MQDLWDYGSNCHHSYWLLMVGLPNVLLFGYEMIHVYYRYHFLQRNFHNQSHFNLFCWNLGWNKTYEEYLWDFASMNLLEHSPNHFSRFRWYSWIFVLYFCYWCRSHLMFRTLCGIFLMFQWNSIKIYLLIKLHKIRLSAYYRWNFNTVFFSLFFYLLLSVKTFRNF